MAVAKSTRRAAKNQKPPVKIGELLLKNKKSILNWVHSGMTGQEIADKLEISLSTWNRNKKIVLGDVELVPGPDSKLLYLYENLNLISELVGKGATNEAIAEKLGISLSTWYKYKAEEKLISEAVLLGEQFADDYIQSRLFKQAVGGKIQFSNKYYLNLQII